MMKSLLFMGSNGIYSSRLMGFNVFFWFKWVFQHQQLGFYWGFWRLLDLHLGAFLGLWLWLKKLWDSNLGSKWK